MPKPAPTAKIEPITYGGASVRLYNRKDGKIEVKWMVAGKEHSTTRGDLTAATQFAKQKVRELATTSGARHVPAHHAERLDWLDRLAGGPDQTPALLTTLEQALATLGGAHHLLTQAASWYAKQGLATATATTVKEAVEGFLAEYEAHHPLTTLSPIRSTLRALKEAYGDLPLLDLDLPILERFVRRGKVAGRTIANRKSHLTTFFNRAEHMGWWPSGRKPPSTKIKRPRTPDKAPEILTPAQGKALLAIVAKEKPRALPYLIIAGWLGCRPSECLRLDWSDFDWEGKLLHMRWEVVGKTWRERWVPITPDVEAALRPLSKDKGRTCRPRSREMITTLAVARGIVTKWPADVLRHSYITYRLNIGRTHDEVAEDSGNSPEVIRSDYRRPVPPGRGKQWFSTLKVLVKFAPSAADSSARASSRNRSTAPSS